MLGCFPVPYKDELFYTVIARYYVSSGNIKFIDTIKDLYEKSTIKAVPDFISTLNKLYEKIEDFIIHQRSFNKQSHYVSIFQ